ncbi:tRNA(Met) cytidine acetyltransferase TmcA [Aidingimonas halophila]|uniref:tRNA(Met) cytidine acetyltransferase TmcA n=1 Tax=Aidingimonas halophila TaxID=574349 RepID=A0A1H2Z3W5_9GAMM|nr:GNAT family N-acetyltransferase [Aidingimonas halophila]GHC15304.1 tRNA(Met) cytidine acetyltransferase TmcA [Aidingimonas halophila]SDX12027.1 tRNA(Met)-cytidine N(4)-acetyltransferase [Aidingimonas halophila]
MPANEKPSGTVVGASQVTSATSDDPVIEALQSWSSQLQVQRWRGLLWVTGESGDCYRRARAIWEGIRWTVPIWVSAVAPAWMADDEHWLSPEKARTRLGGECDLVVMDAVGTNDGFDPEAFGILSGAITAGGLLVLLTPVDWGCRPDADYRRLAEYPYEPSQLSAHYLRRLSRHLTHADDIAHWPVLEALSLPPLKTSHSPATTCHDPDCLTSDQALAVKRLTRLRRRRPLVITADRGRGKTAALGIACARLLMAGERDIWVTAPRSSAVEALFERLKVLCPEGERQRHCFTLMDGDRAHRVRFAAPDALTALDEDEEAPGGRGSILLVDEAAAIPAPLLGYWLVVFPRIAFATTVHGYEGAGRGFALRFRDRLDQLTPEWRGCHMAEPVRWASGDPLESVTSRLLMLDAEPSETVVSAGPTPVRWSPAMLASDEIRLRALFGLLVQAHYRTQPSDLRRLLDGPGVSLAGKEVARSPVAVVVTVDEGGFDRSLADQVALGFRRPQGHLLAQSLAAHAGSRQALTSRVRRIWRIAVHESYRRHGWGAQLLSGEVNRASDDEIDLLGASFGADPGLMAFWRHQGFRAVRVGLTREAASGEHALMVVRGTSAAGKELANALANRFQALLPALLAFELRRLDPLVGAAILSEGDGQTLSADAWRDAEDVISGNREPGLARPALQALTRLGLRQGAPLNDDAWLLVAVLFQGRDPAWLARRLSLSGGKQVRQRLKEALARWRRGLDEGWASG